MDILKLIADNWPSVVALLVVAVSFAGLFSMTGSRRSPSAFRQPGERVGQPTKYGQS